MVPIDDPAAAGLTVRTAFSLASRARCPVSLITVAPQAAAGVEEALTQAATPFADLAHFTTTVVESEDPVEAILCESHRRRAMICLPTRSRGGVSRLLFGSVAEGLVRRSSSPTLCVGPHVQHVALPGEAVEVLVGTDDSQASGTVFQAAGEFAAAIDAACVIAQVIGPDEETGRVGEPPPRPRRDRAETHTAEGVAHLAAMGVPATATVLPGRAASSIVAEATTRSAAFIAVGTTGLSGLSRVTLGSVAADVVRHAPCPVLVVPTLERT